MGDLVRVKFTRLRCSECGADKSMGETIICRLGIFTICPSCYINSLGQFVDPFDDVIVLPHRMEFWKGAD